MATPTLRSLKQAVKAGPLGALLRPRRFQLYCVGPPKSGTVSAYGMFSPRYRSAHEANRHEVVELMISRFNGRLSKQAATRGLQQRDRRLRLEMDSFCMLAIFTEELAEAFPRALFLLTVRDPRSWLNSIINQHLNVSLSSRPADRLLRELLYMPVDASYGPGEDELQRRGLFPLAGYLEGWATHYRWVLDALPSERLLIMKTEELSKSADRLAGFLSIPPESIDRSSSHLHRCVRNHGVVNRLDENLVADKVGEHCQPIQSRLNTLVETQRIRRPR